MPHRPTLTLVCNSHIDPVWLWPWEEGLAATLATFRSAASLCEAFDDFVFCHNEALLYMWVEEHEPALFRRIRDLVRRGRWHIMGGWYVQPDCNLPGGESLVRQVLVGKRYFLDRFGVEPRVAVNLDPFGHSRGLVQILAKSGYDGYLFCRPDAGWLRLPANDFTWVGFDGSTILAHRAAEHYNSKLGKAGAKIERWLASHDGSPRGLLLWGVGNHGGGPSRADLEAIAALRGRRPDRAIAHGTPESYFGQVAAGDPPPRVERDLNPWAAGCYTSMATVKQAHLRLERAIFSTEAMWANAACHGRLPYPAADLRAALEDLLYCQFHDILPGEGIREVERQALDRLGHGLELTARLRARAFFSLLDGQPPAAEGEYPIFVYNHHPFAAARTIECEFQPPEPNVDPDVFWEPHLTDAAGHVVPLQLEKESCNIQNDQRKRLVFGAILPPSSLTRFSCRLHGGRPGTSAPGISDGPFTPAPGIEISSESGLLTRFDIDGVPFLRGSAFRPLLMKDTADPWGMKTRSFREVVGEFRLMSPEDAAAFAGVAARTLAPVRVIERGPVRTVVEALLAFGHSALVLRYMVPNVAVGAGLQPCASAARRPPSRELEVSVRVAWFERDRFLKLALPTTLAGGDVLAQTAYGMERVERSGEELCGHRWLALRSPDRRHALTLINDATYGYDVADGELRVSLLRAPAYAGHPVDDITPIVRQDRYEPREDQGEHAFRFWLNAGPADRLLETVDRDAAIRTEDLMALCAFPSGEGQAPPPGLSLSDAAVRLGALKLSEDGTRLVVRLFEPTGRARTTEVRLPALGLSFPVDLRPFELRTLAVDLATRDVRDTDLLERPGARQ
jgi:alpha-mannosidase